MKTTFTIKDMKEAFEAGRISEFHYIGYECDDSAYVYTEEDYDFESWIKESFVDEEIIEEDDSCPDQDCVGCHYKSMYGVCKY